MVTRTIVGKIAEAGYWIPAKCELLPPGPSLLYMDHTWNAGQGASVRCLQTALGVEVDGVLGPQTESAMQAATEDLTNALHDAIAADYRADAKFPIYGADWLGRNDRGRDLALTLGKGT